MAAAYSLFSLRPISSLPLSDPPRFSPSSSSGRPSSSSSARPFLKPRIVPAVLAAAAAAYAFPVVASAAEPANALSLPTWAIHVSSVVEWVTAMALVWEYGERSGFETWKGLSWGMVPLLGGALCACTWHFFYNSESLEILVAIQAALTVIGNITMCIAAFRICKATQEGSKNV